MRHIRETSIYRDTHEKQALLYREKRNKHYYTETRETSIYRDTHEKQAYTETHTSIRHTQTKKNPKKNKKYTRESGIHRDKKRHTIIRYKQKQKKKEKKKENKIHTR